MALNNYSFDRCEQEPIHIPESIQGYGFLIAFDYDDLAITVVSENTRDIFNIELLGLPFLELLAPGAEEKAFLDETFERVTQSKIRLPIKLQLNPSCLRSPKEKDYLAVVYDSGKHYVVELEPATEFRDSYSAEQFIKLYAMSVAPRFKEMTTLRDMAQEMVSTIRYLTNMDRVVLYKFQDDYSGRVIAESKADDIESYLDLYFPAKDIPSQARELYKVNWVRLVPDTDLPPSPLLPSTENNQREPLDLTRSLLRSFSPIHLQYIKNQGLRASFSISLVTEGDLYGLISCHHREPCYIPQDVRLQCENLSQLFSWHLKAKEEELARIKLQDTEDSVDAMLDKIGPANPIGKVVKSAEKEFLGALETDGFLYFSEYETITLGKTLPIKLVKKIFQHARQNEGFPYINDSLFEDWPATRELDIAGIMIIPLFEKKQYFTAWFRYEQPIIQRWIGAPDEISEHASKAKRLEPRKSFSIHERKINGKSKHFDRADINIAHRLNRMFLVYALEVQERMHVSLAELEKQDRYRNEFLATLAHELRNPLGPIMSGAGILETVEDEGTRRRVTSIINRQAEYMSKLINDLMDVSRITRGKVKLEYEQLYISEVINESLEIVEEHIKNKNHNVIVNNNAQNCVVYGDKARLSQVFSNIIHNAAKYTNDYGEIRITLAQEGAMVMVTVQDNGMGIPQERHRDVFNMFTQIEAHSTHTKGGLGIGLTLVNKLVSLHHGNIDVYSEGIDKGSAFTVRLPVSKAAFEHHQATGNEQNAASGRRIMFVDDNKDLIDTYCLLAESMGYSALGITSPHEAIEAFKKFRPHSVFLDIGMPDIDGFELCKKLKTLPEAYFVRFFSQSGWGTEKYSETSREAGFEQHFVKPISKDKIRIAME